MSPTKASTIQAPNPIFLELDETTWNLFLDRAESWMGNVLMLQRKFREQAEATADTVHEPHIKTYLSSIAETAKEHERKVDGLYGVIGREPSSARKLGGTLMSKGSEALAELEGFMGGAVGAWKDIRMLLIANLDSMGAFAVAEQLGLALGMPNIVDITFPIVHEKSTQHLLLQEYMLDMASVSILYKASI